MKRKLGFVLYFFFAAFTLGLLVSTGQVCAYTVHVDDNISNGLDMSGMSVSGYFYYPSLTPNPHVSITEHIISATAHFSFSAIASSTYTTTLSTDYRLLNSNLPAYSVYTRDVINVYQDTEREGASVSLVNQSGTGETPFNPVNDLFLYSTADSVTNNYPGEPWWVYYYTYYFSRTSGYYGSFTIDMPLDNVSLDLLRSNRIINFDILSYGGLVYDSGLLDVDVLYTTPEPSSNIFLGISLMVLFAYRLRKTQKA
jgi:hypothetical protein